METKKITEGALLSALQLALGWALVASGIGYGFYVNLVLPITMALVRIRCGSKIGFLAGFNTCVILAMSFGNIGLAVYAVQALVFGFLTGTIIYKKQSVQDDILMESLLGCLFLLGLDFLTARLVGFSLLDHDGIDEMVLTLWPQVSSEMLEVAYYGSIASVPVATVLMTYVGSLILGHRLGYLKGTAYQKYYFMAHYKELVPFAYHRSKMMYYAILGLGVDYILWDKIQFPYGRALLVSSGMILLYFVLMDFIKLIGQYIFEKGKQTMWVMVYHMFLLVALVNAFKWTCCLVIGIGSIIDVLTNIRIEQAKRLAFYTQHKIKTI